MLTPDVEDDKWLVSVPIRKVGDNEWAADISELSEEDRAILFENLAVEGKETGEME